MIITNITLLTVLALITLSINASDNTVDINNMNTSETQLSITNMLKTDCLEGSEISCRAFLLRKSYDPIPLQRIKPVLRRSAVRWVSKEYGD